MRTPASLLLVAVLFGGCSSPGILSEHEYWTLGNQAMEARSYDLAIDQFQKLMEEYPFSGYAEEAQLKIAYAQYLSERYAEAIASFQDFQRMHPTSPNLPFAEYYLAMSYVKQMGAKDRDQSASAQAHAHLQAVIDRYPESPFAERARRELRECRERLADHELSIAGFYLHWGNPQGAESRLLYVLRTYPDTDKASEALYRFGQAFRRRGDLVRAAMAFAAIQERYPKSPYAAEARTELERLVAKGVTAPAEPLAALVETLGHPSGAPAPLEEPPSALPRTSQVDTSEAIR
jgi:outer membrane protein assembly factor BamD